jgi:hypothetical protein
MSCPHCQSTLPPTPVSFTWWGGLLGPKLLNHAQCPQCGNAYNASTGKPNTTAIAIYMVVVAVVVVVVLAALAH